MKKNEYLTEINSSNSNAVEEYVQKVYKSIKDNKKSLPYKSPSSLNPDGLDLYKVKNRFLEDGWNLVKKDNHDSGQGYSWTSCHLQ